MKSIARLKQFVSVSLIAATLATSSQVVAPQPAQAGVILFMAAIGFPLIIIGAIENRTWLIILDQDGGMPRDQLALALGSQFPEIEDRQVLLALASALRAKALNIAPNTRGEKLVSLTRAEILEILAPTGLLELDPAAVERIVTDLS